MHPGPEFPERAVYTNFQQNQPQANRTVSKVDPAEFSSQVVAYLHENSTPAVYLRLFGTKLIKRRRKKIPEKNPHKFLTVLQWNPQAQPMAVLPGQQPDAMMGNGFGATQHPFMVTEYLSAPETMEAIPNWDGESPLYVEAFCPQSQNMIAKTVVVFDDEDEDADEADKDTARAQPQDPFDRVFEQHKARLVERMLQDLDPTAPKTTGARASGPMDGMLQLKDGTWAPQEWLVREFINKQNSESELAKKLEKLEKQLEEDKGEHPLMEILRECGPQVLPMILQRFMGGNPGGMMPGMMPGTTGGPGMGGGGADPISAIASSLGLDPSVTRNVLGSMMGGFQYPEDEDEDDEDDDEDDYVPPSSSRRPRGTSGPRPAPATRQDDGVNDLLNNMHGTLRHPQERTAAGRTDSGAGGHTSYHSDLADVDPHALFAGQTASVSSPGSPSAGPDGSGDTFGIDLAPKDEAAVAKITPFARELFEEIWPLTQQQSFDLNAVCEHGAQVAAECARRAQVSTFWLDISAKEPARMAKWLTVAIAREFPGVVDDFVTFLPGILEGVVQKVNWT